MINDARSTGVTMLVCGLRDMPVDIYADDEVLVASTGSACRAMAGGLPIGAEVLVGEGVPDVSPLNLAAAIKHDRDDIRVCVAASVRGGSMASRASSAGVEVLINPAEAADRIRTRGTAPSTSPAWMHGGDRRSMTACFVSGRGGVGKSSLSVLFALAAHEAGLKVALIDMDAQFGDLSCLCEQDNAFEHIALEDMNSAVDFDGLDEGRISLFYMETLPEYAESGDFYFGRFLLDAKSLYDAVFIDTGSHWVEAHADIIGASDIAVFVMDQRPTSVSSSREAMDLAMRLGIPSTKFAFLLNRCGAREQIGGYECMLALGVDSVLEVFDGGQQLEDAFALGRPSSLLGTRNPALESSRDAADLLLAQFGLVDETPVENTGMRMIWRRGGRSRRGE